MPEVARASAKNGTRDVTGMTMTHCVPSERVTTSR